MQTVKYDFVKTRPVARFYYQGSHSHPVRRTVILIEQTNDLIVGYEVREGYKTRSIKNAPVKTFKRSRIARVSQIDRKCSLRKRAECGAELDRSTLVREDLASFVKTGP